MGRTLFALFGGDDSSALGCTQKESCNDIHLLKRYSRHVKSIQSKSVLKKVSLNMLCLQLINFGKICLIVIPNSSMTHFVKALAELTVCRKFKSDDRTKYFLNSCEIYSFHNLS